VGNPSIQECQERLNLSPADYLCSREKFGHHGRLQTDPLHTHVVIEVSEDEAALSGADWKPGIYRLSMSPDDVHRELALP
jgi:hypothetical protein